MVLHLRSQRRRAMIPSIRGTVMVHILAFGCRAMVWKPKILLIAIIRPAAAPARTTQDLLLRRPHLHQAAQRTTTELILMSH